MLVARADVRDAPRVDADRRSRRRPVNWPRCAPRSRGAERPLVLVGGSRWDAAACAALRALAERTGLPVACAFRHQDLFDNRHASYAGDVGIGINPKLAARVRDADVLLVVGERLGEMTTSATRCSMCPRRGKRSIHVHPGSDELGRVYQPAIAIDATPLEFLSALAAMTPLRATGLARADRCRARRLRGVARAAAGTRGRRPVADRSLARRAPARRRDRHQRRGQLFDVDASPVSLSRLSLAAGALFRLDGLRRSRGSRCESGAPRPPRAVMERRRVLPDERTGARDRGSVRPRDRLLRDRQRHVRDDPHAPGANLSGTRARAPRSSIRTLLRWRVPTARTAKR